MRIFKKISAVIVAVSALSTCFVPVVSMAEVRASSGTSPQTVTVFSPQMRCALDGHPAGLYNGSIPVLYPHPRVEPARTGRETS